MKIYVIDNSMMSWAWIAEIASCQKEVEIVGFSDNADEAINKFNELRPDLVIFNHTLLHGSFIENVKKMKLIKPDISFAILSNNTSQELQDTCRKLDIDYFFIQARDYYQKINEILLNSALSNRS